MPRDTLKLSLHENLDFDFGSGGIEAASRACRALFETEILAIGQAAPAVALEFRGRTSSRSEGEEEAFADHLQQTLAAAGFLVPELAWNPEPPGPLHPFTVIFSAALESRPETPGVREGDLLAVSGEPGERAALRALANIMEGWERLSADPPVGTARALAREGKLAAPRSFAALLDRPRLRGLRSLARGLPAAAAALTRPLGAEIWIEDLPLGSSAYRAAERGGGQPFAFALLEAGEPELLMALEPAEYFSLERRAMAENLRVAVIGRVVKGDAGLCRASEGGVPAAIPAPRRLTEDEIVRG